MPPKLFKMLSMIFTLVLVFTPISGAETILAMPDCDPDYVTIAGNEITVNPTGYSDTENLQCAFDVAVETGPGTNIRLVSGTYHTAQIVVNGFHGQFTGAGPEATVVVNLPNLYVAPGDFNLNPPSAENPYPILFFFIGGDYSISEMAFRIIGDEPTQEWEQHEMKFHELACAVAVMGMEANAEISHVLVEGEVKEEGSIYWGYNLGNGIYIEGWMDWMGPPSPPLSGSFSIHHSTFRTYAYGTPLANLSNASVVVSQNVYEGIFLAMDGGDLVNTSVEFSHNRVIGGAIGLDFWQANVPEQGNSTFLIRNNLFRTDYLGVAFEQVFGEGNQCLLLGNNVQGVTEMGIYLGEGIHGCTVVGGSNITNVLDLGTGNILVGVNNMGSGVGPTIRLLMRPR
jgi:hypothetical protein